MNKIIITNNDIKKEIDDSILLDYVTDFIPKLKIKLTKDCVLEIIFDNNDETKIDVQIELMDNVCASIYDIKKGEKIKILTKYILNKSSYLKLYKFSDIASLQQRDIVNLNAFNAKIEYILKTMSVGNEKYDMVINHNATSTTSDIYAHGVNLDGNIVFNVSTYIPKGMVNCVANQNNRIINLTTKECIIRPNLLIDECDVIANHSAFVGNFKDEEIFYLQRLGIPYDTAVNLLIEGFIKSKTDIKKATDIFKKYWR